MPRTLIGAAAAVLLLLAAPAPAQQATEQFIPIGRSPGLSKPRTYVGTIGAVDAGARTVTLGTGADRHSVRVVPETRIWIDRTQHRKTNVMGRFDDLVVGRRVEVKYKDARDRQTADWIKVEPGQAG